nr:MAG TPA: Protein of unknown function (DUF1030) [Caudoviricetes sp.]
MVYKLYCGVKWGVIALHFCDYLLPSNEPLNK